jgi:tetratricopeptide (TPR) repeat protein
VGLLAGGLWILAAEIARLPAAGVVDRLEDGENPPRADALQAETALESAVAVRSDPDYWEELGLVRYAAWQASEADARNGERLDAAIEATERALAGSPGNPHAWTRLAMMRLARRDAPAAITAALEQAVLTGPNVRRLHTARSELILRLWSLLDADERAWAARALERALIARGRQLVRLARDIDRVHVLRGALTGRGEATARLNQLLRQLG